LLDAYLGMPYTDRSHPAAVRQRQNDEKTLQEIAGWKARVKGNKPAVSLAAFTGEYANELYGTITVKPVGDNLNIKFNSHSQLEATLEYMDNDEWLMTYNNFAFGIFPTKFKMAGNKVASVEIKMSDFIEFDPYTFTKK
jgi:hypothetical protein